MSGKPIVVGVDGSSSALHAARWAAEEAERHGLPLRLVHAYEIPLGFPPGIVDPHTVRTGFQEQATRWLREARDAVAEVAPEPRPELALMHAAVVPALVAESRAATLVVLGSRGLGGFTGLLIGSTAVALAGHAHCPVVVVRGLDGEEPPVDGPVVVGVDAAPADEATIAFAFEQAAARGRNLIAVHAWTDTLLDLPIAADGSTVDFRPLRHQADEMLAERLAGWQQKFPEVTVGRDVPRGRPARALLRHAGTAALVVVGTRGRGGFRGLVLGSTSQQLLRHAPCPVAVVPVEPDKEDQR